MTALSVRRHGRFWEVRLGGHRVDVAHLRGMGYLSVLVANPGYEVSAVELAGVPGSAQARLMEAAGPHDPFLDEAAKRAYRRRLGELAAEIDEHEANQDVIRAERARAERDWLVSQLTSAMGLGGQDRLFATDAERARIAVGKAIRRAIGRIAKADAGIGEELSRTVKTGMRCAYHPGGTAWNASMA